MIFRILIILCIVLKNIDCFNKSIKFVDVVGCNELLLEPAKHSNTDIVVPITDLLFNDPGENEILRMKTYFLGKGFYVEMMADSAPPKYHYPNIRFYHTVLSGWLGLKSKVSISGLEEHTCGFVDTSKLLDRFYFTELEIVVSKDGLIRYFEDEVLRIYCKLEPIPVTHLAFGIGGGMGDGRVFYDCPSNKSIN